MKYEEQKIQQGMIYWFNLRHRDKNLLLHCNYNNAHSKRMGQINKSMGVRAGVSDLEYNYGGTTYFIEVKSAKGKMSKDQKNFMVAVVEQGFSYHVVRSLDDFMLLIERIHSGEYRNENTTQV